ncbi:Wiskott-Aldrich syndrome protein family member [Aphelenchoides fujianensis]|nr:Wiskott-Aldrich syndrome protein family member [Aphelenchoides fujianensis]
MPLSLRSVEPANVSVNRLPLEQPVDAYGRKIRIDELETLANGTMANLVRQLSSLTEHVAHLMTDVNNAAIALDQRMESVTIRAAKLQEKYQKGGGFGSHVGGLTDNHLRKAFQTAQIIDQDSLVRHTLPAAMAALYNDCDPPPRLKELNPYRDDGKDALKFYTDPGYFFDLWKEQILKECANDRRMRSARAQAANAHLPAPAARGRSPQKKRKPPHGHQPQHTSHVLLGHFQSNTSVQQHYGDYRAGGLLMAGGGEFMQFPTEYQAPQVLRNRQPNLVEAPPGMSRPQLAAAVYDDEPLPPPPMSAQPPPPAPAVPAAAYRAPAIIPGGEIVHGIQQMHVQGGHHGMEGGVPKAAAAAELPHIDDDDELPPPPPPLSSHSQGGGLGGGLHFLPPGAERPAEQPPTVAAPAAAPPTGAPSNALTESTLTVQSSFQRAVIANADDPAGPPITISTSSTTVTATTAAAPAEDRRPTMLDEIQAGMKLRKVQREVKAESVKAAFTNHNVAAILAQRRLDMHGGAASTSSSEKDGEEDDAEWD